MGLRDKINKFKADAEKDVVDAQKEIVAYSMETLFENSPHFGESYMEQASGQYDANHIVTVGDGLSQTFPNQPTFSKSTSKSINSFEIEKSDTIENVGETVKITNIVGHRLAVETGFGWSKDATPYHTYEQTINNVKEEFRSILKSD